MKRLIPAYKILAFTEVFVLAYILVIRSIYLFKTGFYPAFFIIAVFVLTPMVITLKMQSFTERNIRASDTLIYTGYIFNSIKLLTLLLLIGSQVYLFYLTFHRVNLFDQKALMYDTLLAATVLLTILSAFTFAACFGIANDNRQRFKKMTHSINNAEI